MVCKCYKGSCIVVIVNAHKGRTIKLILPCVSWSRLILPGLAPSDSSVVSPFCRSENLVIHSCREHPLSCNETILNARLCVLGVFRNSGYGGDMLFLLPKSSAILWLVGKSCHCHERRNREAQGAHVPNFFTNLYVDCPFSAYIVPLFGVPLFACAPQFLNVSTSLCR